MTKLLKRLHADESGVSIVETALWLPLVAMAGLGGLEYTNFVLANQKLERISAVTADTIGRNTIPPSEKTFEDTFKAVEKLDAPFDVKEHGRTILTGVIGVTQNGAQVNKIVWQRCKGKLTSKASKIGIEWKGSQDYADGPDVSLNGIVLPQNSMVVVSEVYYKYQPLINVTHIRGKEPDGTTYQRSIYLTRGKAIDTVTPTAGMTPANC
jgi:Flp pilus assembly protein TadG